MAYQMHIALIVLLAFVSHLVFSLDLTKTEITIVTDEDRYTTLNPNATYRPFKKVYHTKGNIIFSAGERIDGDRLIMSFIDESQFARLVDIEVSLWYPNPGYEGKILSFVEFVTDLSTTEADVFFVNDGGIGSTFAEILMTANRTTNFGYQIFMYGY
ncbi:uncharacterized protein LOC119609275 [Lucilia sericata]|uniref:uncharacterized protein LOC119609275 n=1 Tax=Lucilia sericata TaxID=13632 RepID=UPI0018A84770|nr:uncharacterized protein LOC119609275 [Lucilia sericata]